MNLGAVRDEGTQTAGLAPVTTPAASVDAASIPDEVTALSLEATLEAPNLLDLVAEQNLTGIASLLQARWEGCRGGAVGCSVAGAKAATSTAPSRHPLHAQPTTCFCLVPILTPAVCRL